MFAKIFSQIFDSSIAEDWQVRLVFTDLLTLADLNGVVDMTPEAIARRTNVPIEIILRALEELQKPDPKSRSTEDDGRRIRLIDEHRDWGWMIINHLKYREIASEEQRRSKTAERVARYRARNAPVTHVNACNAMQKQRQKQKKVPLKSPEGDVDVALTIYSAYPRKVGKPSALKAINRVIRDGFDPNTLLGLTASYAHAVKGTGTILPHPATWFNDRRFEDDPSTWVRQQLNGESKRDLEKTLERKQSRMKDLKCRHFSDVGTMSGLKWIEAGWRDPKAREEHDRLKTECQQLTERISKIE